MDKQVRLSSFNIFVELKKNPDYIIIVQGYTSAIDLIKKDVLTSIKCQKWADVDTDVLRKLEERGYLTRKSQEEEIGVLKKITEKSHDLNKLKTTFMFAVTYNCNFRCTYCFQKNEAVKNVSNLTFTKEMVDKAYASFLEIEPDRNKHINYIILYGGEPLIKENKEVIEYIINEGIKRNYRFVATTNGYDLNHFDHLLGNNKISEVQVTIDGIRDRHNQRRKHYKENNSYETIITNINMALSKQVRVLLRIHIDKENAEDIELIIKEMKTMGIWDNPKLVPYFANLKDYGCMGENISIMPRGEFADYYFNNKTSNPEMQKTTFSYSMIRKTLVNALKNENYVFYDYCGAHSGMKIFDPDGNIYTCWETIGNKDQIVGNCRNSTVIYKENLDKWNNRTVANIPSCSRCKYALFCGGGCAGHLVSENKDIYNPDCDNFSKLFERIVNDVYETEIATMI